MPPRANDKLILVVFALLAVSSLGLKAAAGPPRDGLMDVPAERFEQRLANDLRAQHFNVSVKRFTHRSSLVVGVRGTCMLAVRDARQGVAMATAFDQDAGGIGTVRYLYRGSSYDAAPSFAMRFGRLKTEALSRLGLLPTEPMPIALATSRGCGSGNFGFSDVRI
jgi:hypothetical protein